MADGRRRLAIRFGFDPSSFLSSSITVPAVAIAAAGPWSPLNSGGGAGLRLARVFLLLLVTDASHWWCLENGVEFVGDL